jgi:hypothetical protein
LVHGLRPGRDQIPAYSGSRKIPEEKLQES